MRPSTHPSRAMATAKPSERDPLGVAPVHELLARCRAGDGFAWQQLFDRYHQSLCRFIHRQLAYQANAAWCTEEIAQRVWCSLWGRDQALLWAFDPDRGTLLAYLTGLARQHLRRQARKRSRQRPTQPLSPHCIDARAPLVSWNGMLQEAFAPLTVPQQRFCWTYLVGAFPQPPSKEGSDARSRKMKQRVREEIETRLASN